MTEGIQDAGQAISREGKPTQGKITRRTFLKGIAGAAGVAALGEIGLPSVNAETPSPTAAATKTATADPADVERAALEEAIARQKKENANVTLRQTATALAAPPTSTPQPTGTPVPPATPDTQGTAAAAETRRIDVLGRRQAEIKATATREAELTATAEAPKVLPTVKPTAGARRSGKDSERNYDGEGSSPVVPAIVGAVGTAAAISVVADIKTKGAVRKGAANWVKDVPVGIKSLITRLRGGGGGADDTAAGETNS